MPTIAIDYTPAYRQHGGIGRYVRELVRALAEEDSVIEYRLFVAGEAQSQLPEQLAENFAWRSTRISPQWLARLWHRAQIPYSIERFTGHVDVFHATDFVLPPTSKTTRTLLTVHDLSFIRVPETATLKLRNYLNKIVPLSIGKATHILADSQATKDDIITFYGTNPQKISVLLSGVEARFHPIVLLEHADTISEIRQKYGLKTSPFVLSVGTIQPRKNYARLIRAIARLRENGHDIELVIAGGKGWLSDDLFDTIYITSMENHVHFAGFVDEADLPTLYNMAVCFAFPSLYEGFGLPILEAMAAGVPVVNSNVSSLPEVAGNATLMIDPYDVGAITNAIGSILEHDSLRQEMIQNGLIQARRFTWQRAASQLQTVYQNLLTH